MPVLEQVLETFPDKVKVVFKHYPLLRSHKLSEITALTAYAAHLKGKFWPVHDGLFAHYEELNDDKIREILRSVGLDPAQIEQERGSQRVVGHVQRDLNEAVRIGVNSVPTAFVNGKRLRDRSFESFAAAIEKELRKNPTPK